MAATLVEEYRVPIGQGLALAFGTVTMDSSYADGGEAIDAAGDKGYLKVFFEGAAALLGWDRANQKVVAYYGDYSNSNDGIFVAAASTTDLSSVVADYVALAIT